MGSGRARVWRTAAEKRRIVELTMQPGMSVSRVAQAEGVNAHQVFDWRRAYRDGRLNDPAPVLLPVVISEAARRDEMLLREEHQRPCKLLIDGIS